MNVQFKVNGVQHDVDVDPMKRLLDTLREDLRLTGTKEGCGEGECGACSVIVDGRVVNSCLVASGQAADADILTVEGLALEERLSPLQDIFIEANATQCGICTPGMLLAAYELLEHNQSPTRTEIRTAIAGNLCRCTGYQRIVDAIEQAAQKDAAP